ncbi:polysaccharide deacetylase [Indibacter alkaliphilus LW1]|uniref:Polysaccharide deacetylase n=2 Tax=Indibacter TaxID=647744 RepID=S2DAV1_INDAL|nr:polysaccharide deacetylase [Indibacter alkaliphilus LW1]
MVFMKYLSVIVFLLLPCVLFGQEKGDTQILKWPNGKKAAVSLTYDDGTLNQFHVALPIMESLGMKGTFYINTGEIPSSKYRAKFLGRQPEEILKESQSVPTDENNLFERASLIRFLDMPDAVSFHDRTGAAFEQGRKATAFQLIDEGLSQAVNMGAKNLTIPKIIDGPMIDWEEIRDYAARGHEFGVHTISHPRLAVLDEANLLFELEKCRDEIEMQLGREFLFSAECPFGTEDERVMEYALEMFPATRNRMPEEFLEEINRSGKFDLSKDYNKEYVQWQRGPLSGTSPELMRSWVDDILTRDDTWLVLVFHGIEGIGWEAIPEAVIKSYFEYIAEKEDIWVGTFAEVTKYMRQRMHTKVDYSLEEKKLKISLNSALDKFWYDQELTLMTLIPSDWNKVVLKYGSTEEVLSIHKNANGKYVTYGIPAEISKFSLDNR